MFNKVVAHDPVKAPVVREALVRFARGSFCSKMDIVKFFEAHRLYGDHPPKQSTKIELVTNVLSNVLYTGYIEYRPWGIAMRKGVLSGANRRGNLSGDLGQAAGYWNDVCAG